MRLWDQAATMQRLEQAQAKRDAADRQIATMNEDQAMIMASIDKWYPWLPAGVSYGLARAGYTALGSPIVQRLAMDALVAKENTAIGLGQVGDVVEEKEKPKKSRWKRITGYSGKDLLSDIPGVDRGTRNVKNLVADNLVTNTIQEHAFGENPFARGLKAFARNAAAVGDFPRQVVQSAYRSAPTDQELFGQDPRKTIVQWGADIAPQTEIGQTTEALVKGRPVDQGSGFFVGSGAKERQHIAEQQHGVIIYPDGSRHARTIGRDLAGLVTEPGSDAYTAISGSADFMVAIGADKATFGNASVARRADRAFKVEGIGPRAAAAAAEGRPTTAVENLLDTMGAIAAPGKRLTVDPQGVDSFLASKRGAAMVDKMVETTSIRTLDRMSGGKWKPADLLAIARETDPDRMREVARRLMTTGSTKDLPTTPLSQLGFTLKEHNSERVRRLNQRMPKLGAGARNLRNGRGAMSQFIREMDFLDMPEAEQEGWLRKLANEPDVGINDIDLREKALAVHRRQVFDEFDDHMAGVVARETGIDERDALKFRKLLQREKGRLSAETNYFVQNGQPKSHFGVLMQRKVSSGWTEADVRELIGDPYDIPDGMVRFFRGEDPNLTLGARTLNDAEIAGKKLAGTWYTPDYEKAKGYAGEGGKVMHVDFPVGDIGDLEVPRDYPASGYDLLSGEDVVARQRAGNAPRIETNLFGREEITQPDIPTPTDLNELQDQMMPSPNWRDVKRQMGTISKHYANGIAIPEATVRSLQTAWKGLVIARPALLMRVMGEIQIAMTLRGASTWLTHPLDMIAYMLGDSKVPETLAGMGRGATDIQGVRWAGHDNDVGKWVKAQERWQQVMNESTFYKTPGEDFILDHFPIAKKSVDPEDFYIGMADEMRTVSTAPFDSMVVNTLLAGGTVDDAVAFAWKNMEDERKVMALANAKTPQAAELMTFAGTDDFIRNITYQRVMQATGGGNPELMQSLKTGVLRGVPYSIKGVANDELQKVLKDFADILPDSMRLPRTIHSKTRIGAVESLKNLHGHALDIMFSNRERTLNRSPEFRQFYFKNAMNRARVLDPAEADTFIANLEKAGMKKNDVRTARYYAKADPGAHPMSLKEVDDLAWAESVDDMQFFLEDLVDKKRWVEGVSIISPFAHVINESFTRWSKILANPNAVAKVERPIRAAKDPELGDLVGLNEDETDPERRGLFYKDANGNERVAFPLSAKMTGLIGAPVPLHGRTQGLNMIGDFSPGVGPFASLPLTAFFEHFDDPRNDAIRDWLFPYGTPKGGIVDRNVKAFLPTWARKAITEESSQQVIDSMYYLANTGDYNLQGEEATPEEINRFLNDAKHLALVTKLSNAAATFFSPTAPTPEWFIEDEGGKRIPLLTVTKDIAEMRDADPRNATLNILEKYGDNVFLMLVGKSIGVSPGVLPATDAAEKWIRSDGKGLRGKYKNTYGFFAPQEGDFSFDAYRRLLDNGDRKLTNPDDVVAIANDMVAKAKYYALRGKMENPSNKQSAALLRDYREQLMKEYPGYVPGGAPGGTINKAEPSEMIAELERSANDKKLQSHEAMPALQKYLALRTKLNAAAPEGRGAGWWLTSNDGRGARALAASYGDQLAQENPAFAGMWEGALRREFENKLAEDDEINALVGS